MYIEDTISAIATAAGAGAVGIVRLSGADAIGVAGRVFRARSGRPLESLATYSAAYGHVIWPEGGEAAASESGRGEASAPQRHAALEEKVPDSDRERSGSVIDEAIALVMRAPKSYTCEDVVELQCHGGAEALREVYRATLAAGARPAERGEFTKRAFLNGRLDLTAAQAVMDVVGARTQLALQHAQGLLAGRFAREIRAWREGLLASIAQIEATIDFPEEGVEEKTEDELREELTAITGQLSRLLAQRTGKILREGLTTAIVGRPNVGKSSLMNALLGEERSIVTDIPGTTRDTVEDYLDAGGVPLRVIDTAGIRETGDAVERIGVERAKKSLAEAALVLALVDGSRPLSAEDEELLARVSEKIAIVLITKSDLPAQLGRARLESLLKEGTPLISISAKSREGLDELIAAIKKIALAGAGEGAVFLRDEREREIITQVLAHLADAQKALGLAPLDLISIDLRAAYDALGEITGETVADDVVDEIFRRFCIGK